MEQASGDAISTWLRLDSATYVVTAALPGRDDSTETPALAWKWVGSWPSRRKARLQKTRCAAGHSFRTVLLPAAGCAGG